MANRSRSITVIAYGLTLLYGSSFLVYLAAATLPEFRVHAAIMALLLIALALIALSVLKLRDTARQRLVGMNFVILGYSVWLSTQYPELVQPGYMFMNVVVALYFAQPSVKSLFIQGGLPTHRKSVLIIDDDEGMLKTIQRILLSNGYSVLTAASGEKGLQVAQLQRPDLILLDVILPGIKGRDVCLKLKEDPVTKGIPVIFLTAKDSPDDIRAEKDAGGVSHLTKPVHARQLLAEVQKIFNK